MMNHLREYLIETLSAIAEEYKARNRVPDGVGMLGLQRRVIAEVKAEINGLCRDNIIEYYKTINNVAFKIKPVQEH